MAVFGSGFDVGEPFSCERATHLGQHHSAMGWPVDLAKAHRRILTHALG